MTRKGFVLQLLAGLVPTLLIVTLLPWSGGGNIVAAVWTALHMDEPTAFTMDQVNSRLVKREAGHVDLMTWSNDRLLLQGWAADIAARKPARSVQVFVNQQNAGAVVPSNDRPDVSKALGISTSSPFGFKANVPANARAGVKVFAEMYDGSFAELHYPAPSQ